MVCACVDVCKLGLEDIDGRVCAGWVIWSRLHAPLSPTHPNNTQLLVVTVCGNNACELGEMCTTLSCSGGYQCARDCPVPTSRCAAATGQVRRRALSAPACCMVNAHTHTPL